MITAIVVVGLILLVLAFTRVNEGGEIADDGSNYYAAYYGEKHYRPNASPPCQTCVWKGCIGAGACHCPCHKAAASTAKK